MLEKIPPQVHDLLAPTYVWLLGLLGAAVGYLEDFKLSDGWKVWALKFVTKAASSGLAAVLTYHMLLAMEIDPKWHVLLIGIASHMGSEALKKLGEMWQARVPK